LWGFAADEQVTDDMLYACVHPEDQALRRGAAETAMDPDGNGEYQTEFRILRRNDGVERWMAVTGRVLFEAGRAIRLVGVIKDITEHKAIDLRLQEQRAEMESVLKQQVAMQTASAIAHELNQPLTAISAYSEVALQVLGSDRVNSSNLQHALAGCVAQSQHAGRILNELLAFLQEGDPVTEPLDLGNLVREALGIMQNDGYGGFFPVLQLERSLPRVLANHVQLQKVLVNLLRNGVEAMRGAGNSAAFITISAHALADAEMVQITIQDNGPGLAEETARRIFEPFFTTKANGIGMGLAICRNLIETHGGQLWLDADASPGATFHLTLPTAP
jgi:PAS domain S-box-containing protein